MNLVFDIGNVLLDFKPEPFLASLYGDAEVARRLKATIYDSREWQMLDLGVIEPEEAERRFCAREPELAPEIRRVMACLPDMLAPIDATIQLLPRLRERGHELFYLSNYHTRLSALIVGRHPFFALFRGGVFSCDVHLVKPDPLIYRLFLSKYQLDPGECVFFDDTQANVDGAIREGILGVLFRDASDVEPWL